MFENEPNMGQTRNMGPDTKMQNFTEMSRETHHSTRLSVLITNIYNIYGFRLQVME